ncbi:formate C-acetyltransferase [Lachnotalea glycerini]|uniref:Formate C-acetyltransferase n=1 Tax=Lachnotalea glycerini TaxID=1763509 RepID=A0A255IKV9_9FIRM|nr:pyruvate formate lyase family protein [Lachnotalea glycerini]PXV95489.1 formate C-acetyltransferase [Lachnotalea glycerini]RDY32809.1 pyruvate formate-lyase [Lachnotalea glycerini]
MNERIQRLRNRLFDQEPRICSQRCVIFTNSMKKSEGKPIALRRSQAFYDVLDKMTVYVNEDELIVGNQARWPKASPIFPEYSTEWLENELNGKPFYPHERPGDKFYYDEEDKENILDCVSYWKGKSLYENLRKTLPDYINAAWDANVIDDTWVSAAGLGNEVVDYELVVNKGLEDVMRRIKERRNSLDLKEPGNVKKSWFLDAALQGNQAVVNFSNRIAEECERQALTAKDEKCKQELNELAEICRHVPRYPARTFHEAVQAIYMILLTVHLESNGHAISLGRFDQYVYPLYKKDLEEGRITREEALEIIEAFFIKCNELNKLRSWPDTEFFLGYQMFINLAVAGQHADGSDATNTISELCVEACENVRLFTPSISVKCCDATTDEFLMKALNAMEMHKGGQPAFYNDKAFIRTLENMGIAKEDLHNWVPDGCIEASIPGKWDFAAKGPWLNVEKVLEIVLNNGTDPRTKQHFFDLDKRIEEYTSTEEILEVYEKALRFFIDLQVETEHINDELHVQQDINAFRASLVDDCIGRCLDLVEGGSIYSADGGPTAGSISAGDALAAIDHIVFEQKIITLEQLLHALATNFEDNQTIPTGAEIRAILLTKAPKYGNDDDRADKWVVAIEEFIGHTYRYECRSSKYGKGPIPCCYSYSQSPVTGNVAFGASIGATPDGRKSGDPVNNGVSPANGSEKSGATAACNSVMKLPTIYIQKGGIFNMRLTKAALETIENKKKIIDMIRVFFDNYGEQIQFNVVDTKIYKDAMKNPDQYKDLMVRVSGYSALFTSLSPSCQIDVISRTELDL